MASNVYTKSLMWLTVSGGVAYVLMLLTAPSEEKIKAIKKNSVTNLTEEDKKKILFLQKLKQATNEDPIYTKKSKQE